MAAFRSGRVVQVLSEDPRLVKVAVELEDAQVEAHGYPDMLGSVSAGDRVVVNTTGIELGLGTGGVGFVLWNLSGPGPADGDRGHIVKLRYTPWQLNVLAAEEERSPHRAEVTSLTSLEGMPVVACGLHSQVAAAAAGIRRAHRD